MNRAQLEALHAALPEEWTARDEVQRIVLELLSLPRGDFAAAGVVLTSMSSVGAAQHSNRSTLWRRGILPPDLSPLEAEKKQREEARQEREEDFKRQEQAAKRRAEFALAPEKLHHFTFIDERMVSWLTALGFDEDQIATARATLPNPMNLPPAEPDPPRIVHSLPPDAVVVYPT